MRIGTHPDCSWYKSDARLYGVTFNGDVVPPHLLLLADSNSGLLVTRKETNFDVCVIRRGTVTISPPVDVVEEKVAAE